MNATISQKGWVVIPAELRKKYHLKPGTEVVIVDYGGVLSILPASKNPIEKGAGFLKDSDSLTAEIVEEHHRERERESR